MSTLATTKLQHKLDQWIDSLTKKIEGLSGDRDERTPKQRAQSASAKYDRHNLQRALDACVAMQQHEGDLPPAIADQFKSMTAIQAAMRVGISRVANGHHDIIIADDSKPSDLRPEAQALREFTYAQVSPQIMSERARQANLDAKLSAARSFDIPGFFPTPDSLVDLLLHGFVTQGGSYLEPSAGIGSVAVKIRERGGDVLCIEERGALVEILELHGLSTIHGDFLLYPPVAIFDGVFMNPPFENGQDMQHIRHAHAFLRTDAPSTLRAIAPVSIERTIEGDCRTKVQRTFHEWIGELSFEVERLSEQAFKNAFRSTGVACSLVTIHS